MKRILKILKTGDYILAALILIGIFVGIFLIRSSASEGQIVSIFVGNQEQYRFKIFENRTITITGPIGKTVVKVEHGNVWVESAPCPHQICKSMGKISKAGEIIVCIPNKLLIRIEGYGHHAIDGMTM
jgi:hypothetical protein